MASAIPLGSVAAQVWHSGASFHPWFFFGFLFWILPLAIFGLVVFLVARWLNVKPGKRTGSSSSALTILEERYAKGEITKEQFDQMKRELGYAQ